MTKEEFEKFVQENKKFLPLYFKDFEFREILSTDTEGMVLQKKYASAYYQTDKCSTEKPYKSILRTDI